MVHLFPEKLSSLPTLTEYFKMVAIFMSSVREVFTIKTVLSKENLEVKIVQIYDFLATHLFFIFYFLVRQQLVLFIEYFLNNTWFDILIIQFIRIH